MDDKYSFSKKLFDKEGDDIDAVSDEGGEKCYACGGVVKMAKGGIVENSLATPDGDEPMPEGQSDDLVFSPEASSFEDTDVQTDESESDDEKRSKFLRAYLIRQRTQKGL